ncbi:MAG TPA: ribonuclease HI family protein [Nitrolancea sp.]|nr:ribonuclease HI family protein [Nitrolancea sp.]
MTNEWASERSALVLLVQSTTLLDDRVKPCGKAKGVPQQPDFWDMEIIFDGGAIGNPGDGYGSYMLVDKTGFNVIQRLKFGSNVTNNQAEYRTMIEGLKAALSLSASNGWDPSQSSILVRTDSKLVVEQVNGRWKVRHPNMQPLCTQAQKLLDRFARWELGWHSRDNSVALLGH